ncbi:MAG: site-2 protease family protein [Acidimicrobiaceae bacterium]
MNYLYYLLAIVPSIVLHEVSHGWVANYFGDPTAKQQGRLTINPLKHIDPFGTVLLPALLIFSGLPMFGYAKPVPVNVSRLRNPRKQSLYVSMAGPLVNIMLSGVGFALCEYAIHSTQSQMTFNIGEYLGLVNITLAAFNLIPIPPLDGSAILERFIPQRNLGKYYDLRSKALPFFMVLIIVDSMFLHIGTGFLGSLQNWWISQLF